MRRTLLLLGVVLASGCAQPYGYQDCKTDKDCVTGQYCPALCAHDAGANVDQSALCAKACSTDADCASLGLKKPACATDLCSGTKSCVDSPF